MVGGIAWATSTLCDGGWVGKGMLWEGAVVTAQPGKHWDPSCELRSLRNIGVLLGLDGLAGLLTLGYSPQQMNREPRVLGCVHIQNN